MKPQIHPLGPDGILVRFADVLSEPANRAALAFASKLKADDIMGVTETATSLTSAFVRFDPAMIARAALEDRINTALGVADWYDMPLPQARQRWHLPTSFGGSDGPGLEEAATLAGVSPEQAIDDICQTPLRVLALGFAPGQPYLGFLPEHWDIPRQGNVTPQVPRGAVVVAVRQVIPFANPAPTGWRQVGRTAFRCYDPSLEQPLPLRPGDEVAYRAVSAGEVARLIERAVPHGGAEVEEIG